MSWTRVKWSEAGQVLDLMDAPAEARADLAGASPQAYFARLRDEGRRGEAADFLAQALPRLEAVAWAARSVRDAPPRSGLTRARERALRAALLWVQDPSEPRRRAAFDAAQGRGADGAEALAALAVFFSGGSIAPPESATVTAPKAIAGRLASEAVKAAAGRRGPEGKAALDRALDLGAAMAEHGMSAGV